MLADSCRFCDCSHTGQQAINAGKHASSIFIFIPSFLTILFKCVCYLIILLAEHIVCVKGNVHMSVFPHNEDVKFGQGNFDV